MLEGEQRSQYRASVARTNYLAQDRCDIQFVVTELPRGGAKPTLGNQQGATRLGRYLIGKTRYLVTFERQGRNPENNTRSDTVYAGCLEKKHGNQRVEGS